MTLLKENSDKQKTLIEAKIVQGQIQRIVDQEIETMFLNEGLLDAFKGAWEKTKGAAQQGWDSIKSALDAAVGAFKKGLQTIFQKLQQAAGPITQEYQNILALQGEAGEKIPVDGLMKAAQDLTKQAATVSQNVKSESEQVTNTFKNAKPEAPTTQQEVYAAAYTEILNESIQDLERSRKLALVQESLILEEKRLLNEGGVIPTAMAALGGSIMITKQLSKWFGNMGFPGAQKLANGFGTVYEKLHHLEEGIIDKIPNKLAYYFYAKFSDRFSLKQTLTAEQFAADKKFRIKVKKYIYTVIVFALLINGIQHLLHAAWEAATAAHVGANTVKAIEVGQGIANAFELGAETLAANAELATTAGSAVVDLVDDV